MSKEYRKTLGFTNKAKLIKYLKANDIKEPNWPIIYQRNERLIEIFSLVNSLLNIWKEADIREIVDTTTQIIKDHDILSTMNNHGRAIEDVYYTWLQGYLAEIIFTPLIEAELGTVVPGGGKLVRNGGDDLTNPENFKRTAAADLIGIDFSNKKVLVDVQAGFSSSGGFDIKKHKVIEACKNKEYDSYVFFANIVDGTYYLQNLKELEDKEFKPNPRWEGQLCWSVPPDGMKRFW